MKQQVVKTKISIPSDSTWLDLHISDIHYDSWDCNRDLLTKHIEQANRVFMYGDLFDLMGGKRDPRSMPNHVRPEYQKKGTTYIQAVIEDFAAYLRPYAHKIAVISEGNHETSVHRHYEVDPIGILLYLLDNEEHTIQRGGYQGFIMNQFKREGSNQSSSHVIYYHHGYGGNAARSKGTLKMDIDSANYPDADYLLSGHTHEKNNYPQRSRWRLDKHKGKVYRDSQQHLFLGTYKEPVFDGGWGTEKGFSPNGVGGWFIETTLNGTHTFSRRVFEAR